ncbi:serine hydrolase domain-containing protein [Amycolatopsis australiensis]|uniref:CubicO group peptidase, beta-lactamase class C family n=1 Tax=Amycolatopsis australiensis TaxID=546364 RepID=A0A1K1QGD2_9PSEU|nr:serine hydrolase domain-containing protein [Amycolatopsis australiensis]SFW58983.1 CubicO group peptidase, beta-lactamase class C family [Amycolatopsis australiensis]
MRARKVLVAAAGVLVALTTLTVSNPGAGAITSHDSAAGRFDRPQHGFAPPWTTLRDGKPQDVGLDPAPIKAAEDFLASWTRPDASGHPHFSGAVGLLAHDGVVVDRYAAGGALRYADAKGTELPADQQVPMKNDTIFDMASISKLFTSIAVLQLAERGQLTIDTPVSRFFPEFATGDKAAVTVKMLLTHTSGFDADPVPSLWAGYPDIPARRQAVLDSPLKNKPGTTYLYSDINLLTLGFIVEKLTGQTLDRVVHDRITAPLGMADTGYNPPASKLDRIAATEFEANPPRGMVRGSVHDENAWSLGGVAGHAGVFSTAGDMAVLAQTILNGGSYRGHRILGAETVRQMLTNYNQQFPDDSHGLGFELDQPWYMGALASPVTAGHTGFTGTTLVIDPESRSFAILLTNRVHPSRSWGSINPARQVWATSLARAMAVRPMVGKDAWTSTLGNASVATLSTQPFTTQSDHARVSFYAFVDTEGPTDPLELQASTDGVNWQPIAVSVSGPGAPSGDVTSLSGHGHRAWWKASGVVPQGPSVRLRWRYSTDPNYTGRGVSVDGVKVTESGRSLLDGERNPAAFVAEGWQLSAR